MMIVDMEHDTKRKKMNLKEKIWEEYQYEGDFHRPSFINKRVCGFIDESVNELKADVIEVCEQGGAMDMLNIISVIDKHLGDSTVEEHGD